MPADMQVKLLRVLESRTFRRVGGERELEYRCRIIAATNRDPQQAVLQGKLRSDLLYRLCGFPLTNSSPAGTGRRRRLAGPPFPAAAQCRAWRRKRLSQESLRALSEHSWPGNVRELGNAVHRAFILADDELTLQMATPTRRSNDGEPGPGTMRVPIGTSLADVERQLVLATLERCGGNKTRAAATLGFSLKTLYNRLHAYGTM